MHLSGISLLLSIGLLPVAGEASTNQIGASQVGTDQSGYVRMLQEAADKKVLWNHHEWLNLVHYRRLLLNKQTFTSAVDDNQFFYAADGSRNPRAELNATLNAFFTRQPVGNDHALCRFPARFNWLRQRLQIETSRLPLVTCSDYAEWRSTIKAGSATLVFPTYQLNSPSSMFGHTLLRLDPIEGKGWSEWLSYAVNFGANISNDDNSIAYAWKGLTGGYPGQFIVMPYFKKIQEYNRIEKRDIWEYKLNLKPVEVERLVTHLWELKEVNFDYFFFTENCSYRLLELIEVARPSVELTDEFVLTAIPVDTVRAAEHAGLIEKAEFRPSQETIAKQMIKAIPEQDYPRLDTLLDKPINEQDPDFQALPQQRQRALVDSAYTLLRIRQTRKARNPQIAKKSHQLLSIMNRYPSAAEQPVPVPVQPQTGHHSKRATFGVLERNSKAYTELGMRMSYHSLEDSEVGYLRGAQINIIGVTLRRKNSSGTIVLQEANLADIISLTPRTHFFEPLSWRVRGGMERVYSDGSDRPVAHISGGAGFTWPFMEDGNVYTLLTGRLEANSTFARWVEPGLGAAAGAMYRSGIGIGHMEFNSEIFTGGEYRTNLSLVQNLVLSRDNALQFRFKREWHNEDNFNEVSLNYNYFF